MQRRRTYARAPDLCIGGEAATNLTIGQTILTILGSMLLQFHPFKFAPLGVELFHVDLFHPPGGEIFR